MAKYYLGERAAQAVRRLMSGGSSVGSVPGASAGMIDVKEFPPPFTVQWSETEGCWIVWLPDDPILLYYNNRACSVPRPGARAASYETGWWKIPTTIAEDEASYIALKVTYPSNTSPTGQPTIEWTNDESDYDDNSCVFVLCVVDYDSTTKERLVWQFIDSAITVDKPGGGGSISASGTVVTSVDYITSTGDPDWEDHKYSIRIKRGRLNYAAATGALTVVEDPLLTQYIATTPLTSEV